MRILGRARLLAVFEKKEGGHWRDAFRFWSRHPLIKVKLLPDVAWKMPEVESAGLDNAEILVELAKEMPSTRSEPQWSM